MARFTVVQPQAEGYEHLGAFDEVAESLTEGLADMGHDATLRHQLDPAGGTHVLLAAHLLERDQLDTLPPGTVVYNHEQIDESSMLAPRRLGDFAGVRVWDYSARNVDAWRAGGIDAVHVPIGWSPGLERIRRQSVRPIDVLFYGSVNERRRNVLDALGRGRRVEVAFGAYGRRRDALIAASKVVINIQFYEARILEMVRLSYLFANGVPVVSETAPSIDVPPGFDDAAIFAPYDELVDVTRAALADPAALEAQGERGREAMRAWPWSRCLRDAI